MTKREEFNKIFEQLRKEFPSEPEYFTKLRVSEKLRNKPTILTVTKRLRKEYPDLGKQEILEMALKEVRGTDAGSL